MRILTVDTWAWVEYFKGNQALKTYIEENSLITPSIVLGEFTRTLLQKGNSQRETQKCASFIKTKSTIRPLDETNAEKSGVTAFDEKLPFADGVIYSYASAEAPLLTGDPHFKNKKNVEFIE